LCVSSSSRFEVSTGGQIYIPAKYPSRRDQKK
jgi:hypothetical protein